MSKVIIKLAPRIVSLEMYSDLDKKQLVAENIEGYLIMPMIEMSDEGYEAAENAFDLTNNPSRQEEREENYGSFRSVSVGDIVEVDGIDFLCSSFGWTEL